MLLLLTRLLHVVAVRVTTQRFISALLLYLFDVLFDLVSQCHHHRFFEAVLAAKLLRQLRRAVFHASRHDDVFGEALPELDGYLDMLVLVDLLPLRAALLIIGIVLVVLTVRVVALVSHETVTLRGHLVGVWFLVAEAELLLCSFADLANDLDGRALGMRVGLLDIVFKEAQIMNIGAHIEIQIYSIYYK